MVAFVAGATVKCTRGTTAPLFTPVCCSSVAVAVPAVLPLRSATFFGPMCAAQLQEQCIGLAAAHDAKHASRGAGYIAGNAPGREAGDARHVLLPFALHQQRGFGHGLLQYLVRIGRGLTQPVCERLQAAETNGQIHRPPRCTRRWRGLRLGQLTTPAAAVEPELPPVADVKGSKTPIPA